MFVGIDAGHTNLKAVAYDNEWNTIDRHGIETGMVTTSHDHHEIPIDERWELLVECLSELRSKTGDGPIEGIGFGGGGGGLYPLNGNKEPFMNGIPLLDERAMGLLREWQEDGTREAISEKTGVPTPPGAAILSLRWLKENDPGRYEQIEHVLNLKDVMRYRLTGELGLEISDATFSFTNHQTQEYDEEIFELAGVPEAFDALPKLMGASYDIAGYTTKEIEEETGISEGTPVVAGAHDACVNSLGVGGIDRDIVTTAGGTWSLSTNVIDEPSVELDTWCCENFLEQGTWMLEISQPTGTTTSDWFVNEFFEAEKEQAQQENTEVWDIIEGRIEEVETNAIFHPFLLGNPYGYMYQANASGSFTGLSPTDGRLEMLRAVYEGIAFMHRWQIEQYDEAFGVEEIRFTGGAARSEFWSQLFADVLETPVTVTQKEESGCFGAAMLAGIAAGEIDDLEETSEYVDIKEQYYPNETDLDQKHETFRRLTILMEDMWDEHEDLQTRIQ